MQAAARHKWGSDDLAGKTVALQGCGHVGYFLAGELARVGAKLIVTDVDSAKVKRVVDEYRAAAVALEEIYSAVAQVFSPCALGGIVNCQTIPRLKAELIVGGANNQLLEPSHGDELERRGILYAPDYAANAGGVINGCCREMLGWGVPATLAKTDAIYYTLLRIFDLAQREKVGAHPRSGRLAGRAVERRENSKLSLRCATGADSMPPQTKATWNGGTLVRRRKLFVAPLLLMIACAWSAGQSPQSPNSQPDTTGLPDLIVNTKLL